MIHDPTEVDFDAGLMEIDSIDNGALCSHVSYEAGREESTLVIVADAEGETICLASRNVAEWLIRLMNEAHEEEIARGEARIYEEVYS